MFTTFLTLIFLPTVELTGLRDCYKFERKKKPVRSKRESTSNGINNKNGTLGPNQSHISRLKYHTCSDESSDEELITCGHKENTFTGANPNPKSSKRIDFILYKLRDKLSNDSFFGDCSASDSCSSSSAPFSSISAYACRPVPLKINAKDTDGLSYSDHQPVAAYLKILKADLHDQTIPEANGGAGGVSELNGSEMTSEQSTSGSKLNKSNNNNKSGAKLKSNGGGSGQWSSLVAKGSSNSNSNYGLHSGLKLSPLLHDIESLLSDFINNSTMTKHVLTTGLVFLGAVILLAIVYFAFDLTAIEMVLISIILLIVCLFGLSLRFFTHRHEINAVKAILNDIARKKSFGTEYGLLASE